MLTYLILAITIGTHITGAHSATHTTYDKGTILQKSVLGIVVIFAPITSEGFVLHNT